MEPSFAESARRVVSRSLGRRTGRQGFAAPAFRWLEDQRKSLSVCKVSQQKVNILFDISSVKLLYREIRLTFKVIISIILQVLTSSVPAAPAPELPVRPRGLLEVTLSLSCFPFASFKVLFGFALVSNL